MNIAAAVEDIGVWKLPTKTQALHSITPHPWHQEWTYILKVFMTSKWKLLLVNNHQPAKLRCTPVQAEHVKPVHHRGTYYATLPLRHSSLLVSQDCCSICTPEDINFQSQQDQGRIRQDGPPCLPRQIQSAVVVAKGSLPLS